MKAIYRTVMAGLYIFKVFSNLNDSVTLKSFGAPEGTSQDKTKQILGQPLGKRQKQVKAQKQK